MKKLIKRYVAEIIISLALVVPAYLIGWRIGHHVRDVQDRCDLCKDLAKLRERYYRVSYDLKDTMTEMLRYKLELQKELELQKKEGGK